MRILDTGYFNTPSGKGVIIAMLFIGTLWIVLEALEHFQTPPPAFPQTDNVTHNRPRVKRDAINIGLMRRGQVAVTREHQSLVFWYNSSQIQVATYTFDYCQVVQRCNWHCSLYEKGQFFICVTDDHWGYKCSSWEAAAWNTGTDWGYRPDPAMTRVDRNGVPLRSRMTLTTAGGACMPGKQIDSSQRLTLNIENPSPGDAGTYVIGMHVPGYTGGPLGKFSLRDMYKNPEFRVMEHEDQEPWVQALANPTFEETIAMETGYSDTNMWLEWMRYTAKQHNMSDCYVCAGARPHLGTVPLPLPEGGETCFLSLYRSKGQTPATTDPLCKMWIDRYPLKEGTPDQIDHSATVYKGNYTCYNSTNSGGVDVGEFPPGYCAVMKQADPFLLFHQTHSLGDIYWLCGDLKLRPRLPPVWKGHCALAKLIMPIHMFRESDQDFEKEAHKIFKRELKGNLDPHVYLDAIGVPRGVPDEFKARNPVWAGFESMIPQITINKNVEWINYIYYNQQRFVNFTRDALQGIVNKLGPNSKMTFQNRMSLDMMLAEKGGVCKFLGLGGACCTYIPSETGPDGRVTEALRKLTDLSDELKRNSGVSDSFTKWFNDWFGDWKGFLKNVGTMILIVILMFSFFACCVIPLARKYLGSFIKQKTDAAMFSFQHEEYNDSEEEDSFMGKHKFPKIDFSVV
ncbi:ERV-BabFcenv provirus ancestral Env polyprotein-like [Hyperolius riggenbachi]|uniref:ERV-BabFcenv provirus ancestral Env polyprotein-like n=1 Tax=Hyperolius riggenbachi TaxID=752182 RepID=UPI0035A2898B